MIYKQHKKIDMGRARPSVKTDKYYVKNIVTPDTKQAKEEIARQEERRAARERAKARSRKNFEKQKARLLGNSLKKKSEKDFNFNRHSLINVDATFKRNFIIVALAIIVVIIGICVGIYAFMASTSAKLSIGDEAKAKLVRVQEKQPYYMLFAADIDDDQNQYPDMLMLTRVSPEDKSFIIIQIPIDTYVASSSGGGTTLNKIYEEEGDAGLIESVAIFSEIGITHYVRINSQGISKLVDAFGGIEVNLVEYVDDITAGDKYIPQGQSTINGEEALILLRAKNFSGGTTTISLNQREVCVGLLKVALSGSANIAVIIDQVAGLIHIDMSAGDIIYFVDYYKNLDTANILNTEIPGYITMRNNVMVFMIDATEWKNLRTQITYGTLPSTDADLTIADIDPSSFTIEIQNGAGITGAASELAEKLKALGFNVESTSNAESNIYKETLIIYSGEAMKKNATVIKNSINNGRLVNGDGLYNMTSDILIIIGDDLKI